MLNGLIKPDHGRIALAGRTAALISLGAGFNPILTGRENIYVSGAVIGLPKADIDAKLPEIVDFAEIAEFIDTPVQSYSAGMQIRLGFAVATALQPDVLLLDEVLAVGDAAFRAKCYERLARIRDEAAFVLVSHDMDQIARVCSHVLVLDRGSARYSGDVGQGIRLYQELSRQQIPASSHEHLSEGAIVSIDRCDEAIGVDGLLNFSLTVHLRAPVDVADLRVVLWGDDGRPALDAYTRTQGWSVRLAQGKSQLSFVVGPLRLRRGRYAMSVALLNRANNLHLYWGDRVRVVEAEGPVTAAVPYTPAVKCLSLVDDQADS
jgi:lipopolysaccharide transport system ATP-binding protein